MASASRSSAPYEQVHRKLRHRHADATYPSLHQLHVHSLHVRDQGEDPFRTSDAECDDVQVLIHLGHQVAHESK